jgi:hypothetical protein
MHAVHGPWQVFPLPGDDSPAAVGVSWPALTLAKPHSNTVQPQS